MPFVKEWVPVSSECAIKRGNKNRPVQWHEARECFPSGSYRMIKTYVNHLQCHIWPCDWHLIWVRRTTLFAMLWIPRLLSAAVKCRHVLYPALWVFTLYAFLMFIFSFIPLFFLIPILTTNMCDFSLYSVWHLRHTVPCERQALKLLPSFLLVQHRWTFPSSAVQTLLRYILLVLLLPSASPCLKL